MWAERSVADALPAASSSSLAERMRCEMRFSCGRWWKKRKLRPAPRGPFSGAESRTPPAPAACPPRRSRRKDAPGTGREGHAPRLGLVQRRALPPRPEERGQSQPQSRPHKQQTEMQDGDTWQERGRRRRTRRRTRTATCCATTPACCARSPRCCSRCPRRPPPDFRSQRPHLRPRPRASRGSARARCSRGGAARRPSPPPPRPPSRRAPARRGPALRRRTKDGEQLHIFWGGAGGGRGRGRRAHAEDARGFGAGRSASD